MTNKICRLEQQLCNIQAALKRFEQQHMITDEILALFEHQQNIKRELSLLKGQETAVPFDFPYPWDTGAPLPHVISNGFRTILIYYIGEHNPAWEAGRHKITDLKTEHDDITALVEFRHCYIYKFGGINDEVIYAHPLSDHGLEAYGAHVVVNSAWIKEQEKINSVHSNYSREFWDKRKHYIFTFHDEIFECIADDFVVEVFKGRISTVFAEASGRLFLH